jgi:hypothetical protein
MPTLLLPPRFTDDTQRLWRAAIAASWDVVRLPRSGAIAPIAVPVLYGECLFVRVAAERVGVALAEPAIDFVPRLHAFDPALVGRDVRLTTLADACTIAAPTFVKPAGDKAFAAQVHASGDALRAATAAYPPEMEVLVSAPVRFVVEHRCFVLDGVVATASIYMRDGDIASTDGDWSCDADERAAAVAFAGAVARVASTLLSPASVLDVGRTDDGRWLVVEANPAWGSGLCGCDERDVLRVLARASGIAWP